jgi:hypothetical protein
MGKGAVTNPQEVPIRGELCESSSLFLECGELAL